MRCVELEVSIPENDIKKLKIFYREDLKFAAIYFALFAFGFATTILTGIM